MMPVDWAILAVVVFSTVTALLRGLVLEVFSLAGLFIGAFVAGWQYDSASPWLMRFGISKNIADAVAFLLIAFGVAIVVSLIGKVLRNLVREVGLGWADRLMGAVFGVARGAAVVLIAVMAAAAFFPRALWVRESRLVPYFVQAADPVSQWFPPGLRHKLEAGREWSGAAKKEAPQQY